MLRKDKNETVQVLFSETVNTTAMYKVTDSSTDITDNNSWELVEGSTYKRDFTMPDEDCVVVIVVNNKAVSILVGDYDYKIVYYNNNISSVEWARHLVDGTEVDNGI